MTQTIHHRLHIIEAADWKDGIITLLEPRSPYRPWRYAFAAARPGDYALVILGTDPVSALTVLPRIGDEGFGGAVAALWGYRVDLVDVSTLARVLDLEDNLFMTWRLDDEDAERVILALHESRVIGDPYDRLGHSSLVAARNLLRFSETCHGCGDEIDLTGDDARDRIHVHTVAPPRRPEPDSPIRSIGDAPVRCAPPWLRTTATDWPAVVCRRCRDAMRDSGRDNFIEFRFAEHPQCPYCHGRRTQRIQYGMPAEPWAWGPWLAIGGCCPKDDQWRCTLCDHDW